MIRYFIAHEMWGPYHLEDGADLKQEKEDCENNECTIFDLQEYKYWDATDQTWWGVPHKEETVG